jgi:hypothetical protein
MLTGSQGVTFSQISAGFAHAAALTSSFTLYKKKTPSPHVLTRFREFIVAADGQVYSWGRNLFGQLGRPMSSAWETDGDALQNMWAAAEVNDLSNHKIVSIACGQQHTVALTGK